MTRVGREFTSPKVVNKQIRDRCLWLEILQRTNVQFKRYLMTVSHAFGS